MKEKKSIIIISPSFFRDFGGAEIQIKKFLNTIENLKLKNDFSFEIYGRPKKKILYFTKFENIYLLKILIKIFQQKVSLIHCHDFNFPSFFLAFLSHFIKTPIMIKITLFGNGSKIENIKKNKLKLFFYRIFFKKIFFHSLSKLLIKDLIEMGFHRNKIFYLPNGVEFPIIRKKENSHKIKYCFTGRLIKRKSVYELVKIFNECNLINSNLNIYGFGPEFEKISNFIKTNNINNISLLGEYNHSDKQLYKIMFENDIFVSLSDAEGLSNSSLEAAAHELLLILKDIPANRSILSENSPYLINNISKIKKIFINFDKSNTYEIKKIALKQKKFLQEFDIKITSKNIIDTYSKLIATKLN